MPNKTIYVSEKDESLFEEAKTMAGEALSSVIVSALREYVSRRRESDKGMKDISVKVGTRGAERQQRFLGNELGSWTGTSDDGERWLEAKIFHTAKGNWAIYLVNVGSKSLLTDPNKWVASGEYLTDVRSSELIVVQKIEELSNRLPKKLFNYVEQLANFHDQPIEYLDI